MGEDPDEDDISPDGGYDMDEDQVSERALGHSKGRLFLIFFYLFCLSGSLSTRRFFYIITQFSALADITVVRSIIQPVCQSLIFLDPN